jgi:hypothetical protein
MRRIRLPALIIICMALVACQYIGTVQSKWSALTPDEKARIILSDMQGQLSNLFDQGKLYVTANPNYQDVWKGKIVPAFDVANKSLASAIALGKTKGLTPDYIYQSVQPNIINVINLLVQIGAIKQ